MIRKASILVSFCIFSIALSHSQVKLTGTVTDTKSDEVIEYANLALLKTDSTFVAGASSDTKGLFAFNDIPTGNYIISATFVGYKKRFVPISAHNNDTNLGKIALETSDIALKDVTVTANAIVQKSDRKVIVPSEALVKASNSGVTLLRNLQLSRIIINPVDNTITAPGGDAVQLRINGVEVTNAEVATLQPTDIIRIEYHDEPSIRYGNVAAVIDYITRRRDSGGSISTNLTNVLFSDFKSAEDHFAAKYNYKKSEFSFNAYYHHRTIEWNRENKEKFILPTKTVVREEIGEPTKAKWSRLNLALNYSITEADKYMFNARLRNNHDDAPNSFTDRRSTVHSSEEAEPLSVYDHSTEKGNTPSLDLYYQRNLKNDQLLIFNVVGTYIDTKTTRLYQEFKNMNPQIDIFSRITGDKYSLIGEGIYEKSIKTGKFSAGLKHTQSYTSNTYSGNESAGVNLKFAETYVFAEYQLRYKKFSYTLGMGVNRYYNSQNDLSSEKYVPHPKLGITYNINDNVYLRYNAYISGYSPSLSDLNNVQQEIDAYQIRRGNPNLKTARFVHQSINAGYNKGILSAELFARYSIDSDPIMENISIWHDDLNNVDKIVRTTTNQKNFHRIYAQTAIKVKPLKDYLTLSLTPSVNRFISNGDDFTHTYTNWRISGSILAMYKKWSFNTELYTRWNNLWAEEKYLGEKWSTIMLGYNETKWQVSAGIYNPFSKYYDLKTINYSKLAPNESYVYTRNLGQMFVMNFTMNLDFGRKYKAGDKRLNNDDSDAGIMFGSKK